MRRFHPDVTPFKALTGRQLDGVVAGGVGDNLLDMLNMMGFRVFEAQTESVEENVELFGKQALPELQKQFSEEAGKCDGASCDHDCSLDCNHSHGDEENSH